MEMARRSNQPHVAAGDVVPAYGKIALVTSVFHPSDVAFARGWSRLAPGIDGWRLELDRENGTEQVGVLPPGAEQAVFIIRRDGVRTVMERRFIRAGEECFVLIGEYDNLRRAVQALCPLPDEALQEIHEELEIAFPRNRR